MNGVSGGVTVPLEGGPEPQAQRTQSWESLGSRGKETREASPKQWETFKSTETGGKRYSSLRMQAG